MKNPGIG